MLSARGSEPWAPTEAVHRTVARPSGAVGNISQRTCRAPAGCLLKEGDPVSLKFAAISSKTAQEGDTVEFVLDDNLKVGDIIVVPKDAHALATVTNSKKAGMMGKGGELNVQPTPIFGGGRQSHPNPRDQRARR